MDSNKLAAMQRTIIKKKYLSEMEIDEMKLKVLLKCENRLPYVEANSNIYSTFMQHFFFL